MNDSSKHAIKKNKQSFSELFFIVILNILKLFIFSGNQKFNVFN